VRCLWGGAAEIVRQCEIRCVLRSLSGVSFDQFSGKASIDQAISRLEGTHLIAQAHESEID